MTDHYRTSTFPSVPIPRDRLPGPGEPGSATEHEPGPARPRALDLETDRRVLLMPPDESHPGPWTAQVGRHTADRIADRTADEPVPLLVTEHGRRALIEDQTAADNCPHANLTAAPWQGDEGRPTCADCGAIL